MTHEIASWCFSLPATGGDITEIAHLLSKYLLDVVSVFAEALTGDLSAAAEHCGSVESELV